MRPISTTKQDTAPGSGEWPTYRLFGLTLASDYAFTNRLTPAVGAPDLTFTAAPTTPLPNDWEETEPAYASMTRTADGEQL